MYNEADFIKFLTVKESITEHTIELYTKKMRKFFAWLQLSKREISKDSIEDFLYEQKKQNSSNSTINDYLFAFRKLERYLQDRGHHVSFTQGFKTQATTQPYIEILTIQEVEKLLTTPVRVEGERWQRYAEAIEHVNLTLTKFLYFAGCRLDEALSLKVRYVHPASGDVVFTKTKNKETRIVTITNQDLLDNLSKLIAGKKPDEYVFQSSKGTKVRQSGFSLNLDRRAALAGITKNVHPHLLRHSRATHLREGGLAIDTLATMLGHKNVQMTYDTYLHMARERIRKEINEADPYYLRSLTPKEKFLYYKKKLSELKLDIEGLIYTKEEEEDSLVIKLKVEK